MVRITIPALLDWLIKGLVLFAIALALNVLILVPLGLVGAFTGDFGQNIIGFLGIPVMFIALGFAADLIGRMRFL